MMTDRFEQMQKAWWPLLLCPNCLGLGLGLHTHAAMTKAASGSRFVVRSCVQLKAACRRGPFNPLCGVCKPQCKVEQMEGEKVGSPVLLSNGCLLFWYSVCATSFFGHHSTVRKRTSSSLFFFTCAELLHDALANS